MCEYVGVGQSRAERTWRRPRSTRHVWVTGIGPGAHPKEPPYQALVVAVRRDSYVWWAWVVAVLETEDGDPVVVQRWVPATDLRPVPANPNRAFGAR